jgi:hypothetical protein
MDFLAFKSGRGDNSDSDDDHQKTKRDDAVPISRNAEAPWLHHEKFANVDRGTASKGNVQAAPLVRLHNEILALCDLAAPTGKCSATIKVFVHIYSTV